LHFRGILSKPLNAPVPDELARVVAVKDRSLGPSAFNGSDFGYFHNGKRTAMIDVGVLQHDSGLLLDGTYGTPSRMRKWNRRK
jgi:hypothetical protein